VAAVHGEVCWTWAAIRESGGESKLAVLRVSGERVTSATFDYGPLVIQTEMLQSPEAARRLLSGFVTGSSHPSALGFSVPTGEVRPHRRTTSPYGNYQSRSGWPEYVVAYDHSGPTMGRQLREIDHLVRGALPVYSSGIAAVAELVYRVPPDEPNIDQTGRVVIALPDQRGRIAGLSFAGKTLRVDLDGTLSACTLEAAWRPTPDSVTWMRRSDPAVQGRVGISTGDVPTDMWLLLKDRADQVLDTRGWSGTSGDRPQDPAFGRAHVQRLLREGEGSTVEYKSALKDDETKRRLARTVAAFSNAAGGVVLLGVNDDGKPVGWSPAKPRDVVADILRNRVRPFPNYQVRSLKVDKKPIHAVVVEVGLDRPYRADDVVTIRADATTRDAESIEIRAMVGQVMPRGPRRIGL
jgi:hypothetical protein